MLLDPFSRRLLQNLDRPIPIALMYHSICPGCGTPDWRWAVSLARFREQLDLLQGYGWRTVCIRDLQVFQEFPLRTVAITFDDGYADNFAAFEELEKRGMQSTWFVVSRDVGKISSWTDSGLPSKPMLSAEQLCIMAAAGMEIGSHSQSHCSLTDLDDASLEDELEGSKADLEGILDMAVESFAFPYGKHDDRTLKAVCLAGYQKACTTRSGWALMDEDLFRIRRISVLNNDSLSTFARKLVFADNHISWPQLARYGLERLLARFSPGK